MHTEFPDLWSNVRTGGQAEISEKTVETLLSLHSVASGEIRLMRMGKAAIPALRSFLFRREPSGIYQPRCAAVNVLLTLGAYAPLRDYLLHESGATDPVELMGDEAVINAAARALSRVRKQWVFQLLLDLARSRSSAGIVEALASFDRVEAIPVLLTALAEDDSGPVAQKALARLDAAAYDPLITTALAPLPSARDESETSLRRRWRALEVLAEAQLSTKQGRPLSVITADCNPRLAYLACKISLHFAEDKERDRLVTRLNELAAHADWILAMEIEHCLQAGG